MLRSNRAAGWRARIQRALAHLTIDPAERKLGGTVSGVLWSVGGSTLLAYPWLPGVTRAHVAVDTTIAALAIVWGLCSLLTVDWERGSPLRIQCSTALAFLAIGLAVWATGGSHSAAWIYLFWVGLFAAYFYQRAVAIAYLVVCIVIQALPFVYDGDVLRDGFTAQLLTAGFGFASIGGAILAGKAHLVRLRARAEMLAAEQGAQRRVATAVVGGETQERIYGIAAREVAALLRADVAGILELPGDATARVVGSFGSGRVGNLPVGEILDIPEGGDLEQAIRASHAIRLDQPPEGSLSRSLGCGSTIVAPVLLKQRVWGAIVVGSARAAAFDRDDEYQLVAFCALLASAVASLEDRAKLSAQALTDPLTGLANHRALYQRLHAELAGARRHGRTLSVAMIDLDNFKEINDTGGHDAGDDALRRVADSLRALARAQDTIGRPGGDEFMWILPDTTREQALVAVERARELIAASVTHPVPATSSAGICDTRSTTDPAELVRLADVALYASKADGRDQATVYDTDVAATLASRPREEWTERAQALVGLRALARTIDAKDPASREHSERVAALAGRLAHAAGWADDRIALLREAALVHDVGKVGVPDVLLRKPGPLSKRERSQMGDHAELSARIVGAVLSEEQVHWIQAHHERPDGRGYPEGVKGDAIPAGAALIAIADAWDVMTAGRTYSPRRAPREALAECLALAGRQFTHDAVAALVALEEGGELEHATELDFTITRGDLTGRSGR